MANNPFPGMNPWLEHPALWGDARFRLISSIARYQSPLLGPYYYVSVGAQAYVATAFAQPPATRYPDIAAVQPPSPVTRSSRTVQAVAAPVVEPIAVKVPVPDVIEETYLEVREAETGQVVTVIEVLSPTNKRPGVGRQKYKRKRLEILSTHTNLVEIDLLRAWTPMPFEGDTPASHYRILVRRGEQGSQADLYPFTMYDPIPGFPLPLQAGEAEPPIDLNTLLDDVYAEGSYGIRIDYHQPPRPPLSEDEARWAKQVIAENVDSTRVQRAE